MSVKCKDVLLYVPAALNNSKILGGQVTAAKGIIRFIQKSNMSYDLVDSAPPIQAGYLFRKASLLSNCLKLLYFSVFRSYRTSLFFKSTVFGLVVRFVPALVLNIKGVNTAIFFRNSSLLAASTLERRLAKILLAPYKIFFVQGTNLRSGLMALGIRETSIHVVPNWLPPNIKPKLKTFSKPKPVTRFVFTGSLIPGKGVFTILDAVKHDTRSQDYTVTFIGDGVSQSECRACCDMYNLGNITFLGSLPHNVLIKELEEFDVLLLPSFSEGFPNSILEALALGLPVIASGVGEIKDTVKNDYNGFLVEPRDSGGLLKAMHNYLEKPELAQIHSVNCYKSVVDRHGWDKNCRNLFDILYHS